MYFLGIDSGGTKAAFLLGDEKGNVYARYRAGGCAALGARKEGMKKMVSEGLLKVCEIAGITKEDIRMLALGISGYGEGEGIEDETLAACEEAFIPGRAVCQCDTYVGWAGSLLFEPGINIIAGTGSVVYGVNQNGKTARSSGWGAGCDEGSCSWHGQRLVEAFTKQADFRWPRTKLYDMFRQRYQIDGDDHHFVMPLNREVVRGGKGLAELQYLLKEIWDTGDEVANEIYEKGAEELYLGVQGVARQLQIPMNEVKVSYSGGLFKSGKAPLKPLEKLITQQGGELIKPRFEPDVGALMMAIRSAIPTFDPHQFVLKE